MDLFCETLLVYVIICLNPPYPKVRHLGNLIHDFAGSDLNVLLLYRGQFAGGSLAKDWTTKVFDQEPFLII